MVRLVGPYSLSEASKNLLTGTDSLFFSREISDGNSYTCCVSRLSEAACQVLYSSSSCAYTESTIYRKLAVTKTCTVWCKSLYWPALQVRNKTGITDIGLAANPDSYSFFGKCAFDLDREKSIFMAFAGSGTSMTATDRLQSNTTLLQILAGTSNT